MFSWHVQLSIWCAHVCGMPLLMCVMLYLHLIMSCLSALIWISCQTYGELRWQSESNLRINFHWMHTFYPNYSQFSSNSWQILHKHNAKSKQTLHNFLLEIPRLYCMWFSCTFPSEFQLGCCTFSPFLWQSMHQCKHIAT